MKNPDTNANEFRSQTHPTANGFNSLSPATHRGSTITFPDYESFINRGTLGRSAYNYGLNGTPTTRELSAKLTELENGCDTFLTPSGLMAISVTLLACLNSGDCLLLPETVYGPVRRFASDTLAKFGIEVCYYDPTLPESINWDRPNLKMFWIESPGSITMEVQDITALVAEAKTRGILVGCDNSWASPLFCRPIDLGVDIVVEAVTKYLSGHSDLLLGSITTRDELSAAMVYQTIRSLGVGVSPDDCFLALRGLETARVRLDHIDKTAPVIARHIETSAGVEQVLYPALASNRFHKLWRSQFSGASGVFSFVMKDETDQIHAARYARLEVFKLGASWGGTHSLVAPSPVNDGRAGGVYDQKRIVRISVGLEPLDELINDVTRLLADLSQSP